jgi:DNA-binding NtrC family response regulator
MSIRVVDGVAMRNMMIVDDDLGFARSAAEIGRLQGFRPHLAHSLAQARGMARTESMDVVLLDLDLPDGSGLELVEELDFTTHGHLAIVTGNPSIETAAFAVSAPVIDYLVKPFHPDRLVSILRHASQSALAGETPHATGPSLPGVISQSAAMRGPVQLALRIAPSDASIFLEGETGTGKEVFARAIHEVSGREGRFVAVNCGAMPSELLASQLFGHERGSFTGAMQRHAGVFEQAANGTLFLDEITEMPVDLQVYLLRVLESGAIKRVGAENETPTSVRVLAATNRDPIEAIAEGRLREDLYYRLADFTLNLPPLRHRDDDVTLLAAHVIEELNARYDLRKRLAYSCIRSLQAHSWPGNVRELRSAVQRAYLLASGDQVMVAPSRLRLPAPVETDDTISFVIGTTWAEMERHTLLKVLAYCGNDKTAAAKMLGVSVRTIHNHLARFKDDDLAPGQVQAH